MRKRGARGNGSGPWHGGACRPFVEGLDIRAFLLAQWIEGRWYCVVLQLVLRLINVKRHCRAGAIRCSGKVGGIVAVGLKKLSPCTLAGTRPMP
jgi:hypothetical protein